MYMFISAVAALVSVIMIIIAADFLSNDLPPAIAVKYFQTLTFPELNVVTGLVTLSSIMAVIGGFIVYMARASLNRREITGLSTIVMTGLVLFIVALASSVGTYVVYQYYVGSAGMFGPLFPGTLSLFISMILLLVSTVLTILTLIMINKLRRLYSPRRIRRQRPPPQA